MKEAPNVSIVILNWNTTDNTLKCLEHLLRSTYKDFEIIIVDNGSTDTEVGRLRAAYGDHPKVTIVCNGTNRGFCEGNNIGILNSNPASRWGMTLNGDTAVGKTWLHELVTSVEREGATGGTCTRMPAEPLTRFGSTSVTGFGGEFQDPVLQQKIQQTGVMDTLTVSGAWFLYDKQALGLPYPNHYFMYGEDAHLGMRIWLRGGRVIRYYSKDPHAFADHFGGHVLQKRRKQFAAYIGTRNRLTNMLYFYSPLTIVKIAPMVVVSQLAYTIITPRLLPARIAAFAWIPLHPRKILRDRAAIQRQRKVRDDVLLHLQTSNMVNEAEVQSTFAKRLVRWGNKVFVLYGRLVGLPTRDVTG